MGNRILKESVRRSAQIDALSWFEEVVFYRLITLADDYGNMDGRPVVLTNDLFPTKDDVERSQVEAAVAKLIEVGLLEAYQVRGAPYLRFPGWERHQSRRNRRAKYPPPEPAPEANATIPAHAGARTAEQARAGAESLSLSGSESLSLSESYSLSESAGAARTGDVEDYVRENLSQLTPRSLAQLREFAGEMPEEFIRHAVDEAVANGSRHWSYVRAILSRYREQKFQSLAQILAAEAAHRQGRTPAGRRDNYQRQNYTDEELKRVFYDFDKEEDA